MVEDTQYNSVTKNDVEFSQDGDYEDNDGYYNSFTRRNNGTFSKLTVAFLLIIVILLVGSKEMILTSNQNQSSSIPIMESSPSKSQGKGISRPCTFDECNAANCNPETAPHICLFHNGGPHGGCSPVEWTEETCDEQCTLEGCNSIPIPETVDTCRDVVCGEDWCGGGSVCGVGAPYQCLNGSGRFGCSDDEYHWMFRSDEVVCSECCDTRSCIH